MSINKKWLVTAVVAINAVAFVALGEIALRIVDYRDAVISDRYKLDGVTNGDHFTFDPVTGYAMIPNIRDRYRSITTDEFGDRITSLTPSKHERSIVIVGDSAPFGWGVKDDETFAFKMSSDPRFAAFSIVNESVPSYTIAHVSAVLREKVKRHNPALVIVEVLWPWKAFEATAAYGSADGWRVIDVDFYKKVFPVRPSFVEQPPPDWRSLRIPVFLKNMYFKILYGDKIRQNLLHPGIREFSMPKDKEIEFAVQHINALHEAVASLPADTKVLFYVHPYQYTIFHEDYKHMGEDGYRVLLEQLPAPDLKPLIKDAFHGEPLYIDGGHLTPEGHMVFAKLIGDMAAKKLQETRAER